ncbi:hypothetical protein BSU00_11115 [Tenacibaculum sp. SG-28]|nr:hypothetical protein BSU00_11115 [Tenacibaculum sp. SG-28]
MVAVDFIYQGTDLGEVKKNAPLIIAKTMGVITGVSMFITSFIMGVPVLRDFQYNMEALMFINPIKKQDYLLGRFLGSFLVLLMIFSSLILGTIIGDYMPWRDAEKQLPFTIYSYVKPFFTIVVPILFFGASLFFVSGTLYRKLIIVYTQGLIIFILFMATRGIDNEFLGAILDPFALNTLTSVTKSWSIEDINQLSIPNQGVLFWKNLLYSVIAFLVLMLGFRKFNYNVVPPNNRKKKEVQETSYALETDTTPKFQLNYSLKGKFIQFFKSTLFYFNTIIREISFWAIVLSSAVILIMNSISLGTTFGVDSYPATQFIVEELLEMSSYFFIILFIFYSGELIWKERDVKFDIIYNTLPNSSFISMAAKYCSLLLVYGVLMLTLILSGIVFQIYKGYYNFQIEVYLMNFFGHFLTFLALYTVMSFFIHKLLQKKYISYLVVILFLIVSNALPILGYQHSLLNFGGTDLGVYSQMNGFGLIYGLL